MTLASRIPALGLLVGSTLALSSPALAASLSLPSEAPAAYLSVGGQGREVPAQGTVQEVLTEAGVTLGTHDKVSAPLDSLVAPQQFLKVVRGEEVLSKRFTSVAFSKTISKTPASCGPKEVTSLAAQKKTPQAAVTTQGKPGVRTDTFKELREDGELLTSTLVSSKVTTPAVPQVTSPCLVPPLVAPTPKVLGKATASAPLGEVLTPEEALKVAGLDQELAKITKEQAAALPTLPQGPSSAPKAPAAPLSGGKAAWMQAAGIPQSDWSYVDYIVEHESNWIPTAVNKSSGACSLVQALPCSKIGPNWKDPVTALKWQKAYVDGRYGGYKGAYEFWTKNRWY